MHQSSAHTDYYRNRIAQERAAARRATDPLVKRLHEDMAGRYESLLAGDRVRRFTTA